jgi:hypothetical protein
MELLGEDAQVEDHSVRLEILLILMHDRRTVYAECTISSEIILDAADGTPT